jgi:site-specific recombinase XerD
MSTQLKEDFTKFLTVKRYAEKTSRAYVSSVFGLAQFHMKAPDTLNDKDIQEYLHYLIEFRKLAWSSCNVVFSGLQCFYGDFLKWENTRFSIPPRPRIKKLPGVMSQEEVFHFLDSITNLKHRALLMTVYSAGLRVSEVVKLQPHHIESAPSRMMILVEQGKGRKDRYTILSQKLLDILKAYWREYRPENQWIFPGSKNPDLPMPISTAQQIYYNAKKKPE